MPIKNYVIFARVFFFFWRRFVFWEGVRNSNTAACELYEYHVVFCNYKVIITYI
jgi:hypothetical protein